MASHNEPCSVDIIFAWEDVLDEQVNSAASTAHIDHTRYRRGKLHTYDDSSFNKAICFLLQSAGSDINGVGPGAPDVCDAGESTCIGREHFVSDSVDTICL